MPYLFAQDNLHDFEHFLQKAKAFRYENFDSAAYYVQKAEAVAGQDEQLLLRVRGQQGGIYYVAGKYSRSLNYFVEAYEMALRLGSHAELGNALNGRGLIALAQHEYTDAVKFFQEALQINEALGDNENITRNLFNLGISLSELGLYEEALQSLQRAADLAKIREDEHHLNMIHNRLGRVYFELQDYDLSRWYYQYLLGQVERLSNWEKAFLYAGLSELDLFRGNYSSAVDHAEKSLAIATEMRAYWDMERASRVLSQAYEGMGNLPLALEFARKNRMHQDSLYSREKNQEISFLKLQLAEADNERLLNEKEFIEQKALFTQYFAIGLSALIVLLIGLLFAFRRNLKLKTKFGKELKAVNEQLQEQKEFIAKQNEELKEIDLAKNKLFSILSHDLKMPIQTLKQFLMLNSEEMMDPEELNKGLPLLYLQVVKTERLMENLLQWSKTQLGGIQTKHEEIALSAFIKEVLGNFEHTFKIKSIRLDFHSAPKFEQVVFDRMQLLLVLQNIVNNAIKYSPKGGEIKVFFSKEGGFLRLHIQDEGPGMSEKRRVELESAHNFVDSSLGSHKEVGTGLGLLLVKQFMELNGGKVSIKSKEGEGTEVILDFLLASTTKGERLSFMYTSKRKVS
ncbi:MAG: tetratricopeptide repeat-containing sensor histidine kinase [Cecembia sp.]